MQASRPLIVSGAAPDTPALRVDANTATSPFSGVVSLNIRYGGQSFICSGAMISAWHVATAGHCVDTNGLGSVIDITRPGNDVLAVFNASNIVGSPDRAVITANKVDMHPDYAGFGICPVGVGGFCVNDDLAIVRLSQAAPSGAKIYSLFQGPVTEGTVFDMVGYGVTGDGLNGYTQGPSFRIKRKGQNVFDFAETNDEANFSVSSAKEVWYADFDGTLADGTVVDTFCNPNVLGVAVCGTSLGNDLETNLGGGDSGGPSFVHLNGEYQLAANNTFGFAMGISPRGGFGDGMGGILERLRGRRPRRTDLTQESARARAFFRLNAAGSAGVVPPGPRSSRPSRPVRRGAGAVDEVALNEHAMGCHRDWTDGPGSG